MRESKTRAVTARVYRSDPASKPGIERKHELEPLPRPRARRSRERGRDRDADRAARGRSRRDDSSPRPPLGQAPDGRAVHLLRPDGAGRVPDRPGHRRAPAPAHQPLRPSPICSRARSCTATASAPRRRSSPARSTGCARAAASSIPSAPAPSASAHGQRLFGIQTWMALPADQEESDPAFVHHGADDLPIVDAEGIRARLIAGGPSAPARR